MTVKKGLGTEIVSNSLLKGEEATIGYAICLAFRSKRLDYKLRIGQKFSFEIVHKGCNREESVTNFATTLASSGDDDTLKFVNSEQSLYFNNVEDHKFGFLGEICTGLLKGEGVNNTYESENGLVQVSVFNRAPRSDLPLTLP